MASNIPRTGWISEKDFRNMVNKMSPAQLAAKASNNGLRMGSQKNRLFIEAHKRGLPNNVPHAMMIENITPENGGPMRKITSENLSRMKEIKIIHLFEGKKLEDIVHGMQPGMSQTDLFNCLAKNCGKMISFRNTNTNTDNLKEGTKFLMPYHEKCIQFQSDDNRITHPFIISWRIGDIPQNEIEKYIEKYKGGSCRTRKTRRARKIRHSRKH